MHGFVIEDGTTFMTTNMKEVKPCTQQVITCTDLGAEVDPATRAYRPWMVLCQIGFEQMNVVAEEKVWLDKGDLELIKELISGNPTQPLP